MGIRKCIDKMAVKVGVAIVRRMSPVLKEAIDNPENLKFEGYVDKDEFIIKVKIKDET